MRFLHVEADALSAYLRSRGLPLSRCERKGSSRPSPVDESAIPQMLKATDTLWGAHLPYYLRVGTFDEGVPPPLRELVAQIEAQPDAGRFLIVAYQDGGLISVSGLILPFQIEARPADWWRP